MCSGKRLILAILALILGTLCSVPALAALWGECDPYWSPPGITRGYTVGTTDTTYYVDAVNGDDSNAGTIGAPWKTLYPVNTASFNPGDTILFHRGQTWKSSAWYEQILYNDSNGNSSNYILYGAYGDGADPIFDGSLLGWGSGVFAGAYSPGAETLSYVVFKNLHFKGYPECGAALTKSSTGNPNDWTGTDGSQHIYFDNCVFEDNAYGGLYVEASDTGTSDIQVLECLAFNNGTYGQNQEYAHGFKFSGGPNFTDYSITGGFYGCTAYNNQGAGFYCSTGGRDVTIQSCISAGNGGPSAAFHECDGGTIEYCTFNGQQCCLNPPAIGLTNVYGIALWNSADVTIRYCTIRSHFLSGIAVVGHLPSGTEGHSISECVIYDNGHPTLAPDYAAINLYNTSLVDSVSHVSIFGNAGIRHNGATHCTIHDCAIEALGGWACRIDNLSGFSAGDVNSNTYYAHFTSYPFNAGNTNFATLGAWTTATAFDSTSQWGNPNFDENLVSSGNDGITAVP